MLAHERTLMAWTRTATSLISFGFTLHTFFEHYRNGEVSRQSSAPHSYALAMISVGLICLLLATVRHWRDVRHIEIEFGAKPRRLALSLAALVSGLGIFGLVAVLFRL
jgi:putative membrane protein